MKDTETHKPYTISTKNLPSSQIELVGEISWEEVSKHRQEAIKSLSKDVSLDGFRKGKVPEALLVKHVGEMALIHEMADSALRHHYEAILEEYAPRSIGKPHIILTKLAKDNPLGFTITLAQIPDVTLPDYTKISKKVLASHTNPDVLVEDTEVQSAIKEIRKQWAVTEKMQKAHEQGETLDPRTVEIPDNEIPEITPEMLSVLGNFETVKEFEARIKESMVGEKKRKDQEKKRVTILEAILEATPFEVPDIIVESELDKMMGQFEQDVQGARLNINEYLTHVKKTRDDLRNEWKSDAIKRARTQFILSAIARKEELKPDEDRLAKEMETIMNQHKDANRFNVRMYLDQVLTNEKVLDFLESQGV